MSPSAVDAIEAMVAPVVFITAGVAIVVGILTKATDALSYETGRAEALESEGK